MKKISILCITPSLNKTSGVTHHIMNFYRKIDHNIFNIDFLIMDNNDKTYNQEIIQNGDNLYLIKKNNVFTFIKNVENFLKDNKGKYDIIHCHTFNWGAFFLYYAKKYKYKVRIIHMHSTKLGESKFKQIVNKMVIKFTKKYANIYFACSEEVGENAFQGEKYYIINNSLNLIEYQFNNKKRKKIRKENFIDDDDMLVGHVGRLSPQKNQLFLLDIFSEMLKIKNNVKFLIIGNGPEKNKIYEKAKQLHIYDKIIFKENITNVNDYYSAMDVFLLPSLFEGLGIVLVEAQTSGLPCFASQHLPKAVFITDSIKGIDINLSAKEWADIILNSNLQRNLHNYDIIEKSCFSITKEVKKLEKIYLELIK